MAQNTLPLSYDITVYSGTSFRREFRWKPDGIHPIDFTGWSAVMLVGQQLAVANVELTTDNGGVVLTSFGQIIIAMTPFQTKALKPPLAYYNLDLTEPDGFVRRFLRGRVSVAVDVRAPTP